jgi:hypothetical protein
MAEEASQLPISKPAGNTFYFLTIYCVSVGVLHLWGFWSKFKINILEYISVADVIRPTAYPIASVFVFLVIGAGLGELFLGRRKFPFAGGRDTATGKFLQRIVPFLIYAYRS